MLVHSDLCLTKLETLDLELGVSTLQVFEKWLTLLQSTTTKEQTKSSLSIDAEIAGLREFGSR